MYTNIHLFIPLQNTRLGFWFTRDAGQRAQLGKVLVLKTRAPQIYPQTPDSPSKKPGVVVQICNLSSREVPTEGFQELDGQLAGILVHLSNCRPMGFCLKKKKVGRASKKKTLRLSSTSTWTHMWTCMCTCIHRYASTHTQTQKNSNGSQCNWDGWTVFTREFSS